MRKFLEKSSHDAVITVFILAQKGKMAFKTPFVPRELKQFSYFLATFIVAIVVYIVSTKLKLVFNIERSGV